MPIHTKVTFVLALAAALPSYAVAQNRYIDLSLGYSRPPMEKESLSTSIAYAHQGRWWRLKMAGDMLMSANESDYYMDDGSCRDGSTGRFAESSLCGPEMAFALRLEPALRIPGIGLSFGPGYRLAADTGPYGFAQIEIPSRDRSWAWMLRGSRGENFVQVEAGVAAFFGGASHEEQEQP